MSATLIPAWVEALRAEVEPKLSETQRLAAQSIWDWFDDLWETEQVLTDPLEDLREQTLPLFERLRAATTTEQFDQAISLIVRALGWIDQRTFHPRFPRPPRR